MNRVILKSSVSVGMRTTGAHGCRVHVAHGGVVKRSTTDLAGRPGGWEAVHSLWPTGRGPNQEGPSRVKFWMSQQNF